MTEQTTGRRRSREPRRGRAARATGDFLLETVGELAVGVAACALVAGLALLAAAGWQHQRVLTLGLGAAATGFLGYGVWAARRPGRRTPVARLAIGALLVVGFVVGTALGSCDCL